MASTETIEQVKQRIQEVDPAEAQDELEKGGVALIDTREPNEYIEAHIDGAELIRPVDVGERIEEVVPDHSQRVILYTTGVGQPKTESARKTIEELNPDVKVVEYRTRLDATNIIEIIKDYDVIVDGADNFPTRYLLNDASVRLRKPVVSASILAFEGQISTFVPYEGPCYRCLYPVPPPPELAPSCGAAGVLGVMAGVMGLLQANEVIKLAAGVGEPLVGRLLLYESLGTRFTELKVPRDPACPICGPDAPEIPVSELGRFPDYEAFCGAPAREG